jgi:uncharacterized caspase-like protein
MKYALIIGNNKYDDPKLAQLKTPAADSQALAKVLSDKNIGYFDEVTPLVNKTEPEIRRAISSFLTNKKPDDLVLVYFSGHGVLDDRGRLFLSLKDTQTALLKATAIPSRFISDEMDSCRSKRQILILDCCHSGAFARGTKGEQKAVTEATFEGSGYGRVVMTASDSTQYALEGDQVIKQTDLSLFTHFLLEGLKTGEADTDNDGHISLDEWYDYTYTKVISETPNQIPHRWSYNQQGDLIIARNPNVRKRVVELPFELVQAAESPFASIRESALNELGKLLRTRDAELANLARLSLNRMKEDDSRRISSEAERLLTEFEKAGAPSIDRTAIFPKTTAEMETGTESISSGGSLAPAITPIEVKPSDHHPRSPVLMLDEASGIKWIEIAALMAVTAVILDKYNISVGRANFPSLLLFGALAGIWGFIQWLVFRNRLGNWWISANITAGVALGFLHNYLYDHTWWAEEHLGILLAIWVIGNLALGSILTGKVQERSGNASTAPSDGRRDFEYIKTGARQNIFLLLLSVCLVFGALYSFLFVFLAGPELISLTSYAITALLVGVFFIARKEVPRNFGFITLASFFFLDGINGLFYVFNPDMPLLLISLTGFISLASGTFFVSQRETWKNLGFIMLSGALISVSIAYFDIANLDIYSTFSTINGFFAILAAVFIFWGK